MKWLLQICVVMLMLVTPVVAQDYKKGIQAYERGDYETALRELQPLAEKGEAAAQLTIGNMKFLGRGIQRDHSEAAKWFRRAAEQGDGAINNAAQHNLGNLYYHGLGVTQDYTESARWYQRAAEGGDADARGALGLMYAQGKGVEKDYSLAHKWWEVAAVQGLPHAQFNLGVLYFKGLGVAQNDVRAHMWFDIAAENGHKKASAMRNQVAERMTAPQISEARRMNREWNNEHGE